MSIDGTASLQIKNPDNLQRSPEGEPNHTTVFAMTCTEAQAKV